MISFLTSNPLFILLDILIVMLVIIKLFFPSAKKSKEKNANQDEKIEKSEKIKQKPDKSEPPKVEPEKPEEKQGLEQKSEPAAEQKEEKQKKTQGKATVSKVYEKVEEKEKTEEQKESQPEISEEELLKKHQFVKTSKKVSKLVKSDGARADEQQDANLNETGETNESDEHANQDVHAHAIEEISKAKHGHFDRSRRLSRCVKDDNFDEMFSSHISDHYLNINVDRHLKVDDEFTSSLYDRASKTLANSGVKVITKDDHSSGVAQKIGSDKDSMRSWLEDRRREELAKMMLNASAQDESNENVSTNKNDDLNLTAKNLVVAEMIMNRKKISKH
jgi:hypothetical protein